MRRFPPHAATLAVPLLSAALLTTPTPATSAAAEAERRALVVGIDAGAPGEGEAPTGRCAASARAVSAALRGRGFEVVERIDPTRAAADSALAGLARRLRDAPGATAVAYWCGRFAEFNDRTFLLPAGAAPARDADVLTQGILARLLTEAPARGAARAALVALDLGGPQPAATLPALAVPAAEGSGVGLVVAATDAPSESGAATVLARALAAALAEPEPEIAAMVSALRARLEEAGSPPRALRAPERRVPLLPPPAEAPAAPAPAPTADVAPEPPMAPTAAPTAPTAPEPAAPALTAPAVPLPAGPGVSAPVVPVMPEESRMTEADRRRVQAALGAMGYYSDRVDGRFGAGTRAAIRRFQFELGAEMTGVLTPQQAGRLVGGAGVAPAAPPAR